VVATQALAVDLVKVVTTEIAVLGIPAEHMPEGVEH
jgi:hypothetical protein